MSDTEKNPVGTFKRPLIVSTGGSSSPTLFSPKSPEIPEPNTLPPKNIKVNLQIKNPKLGHGPTHLHEKT